MTSNVVARAQEVSIRFGRRWALVRVSVDVPRGTAVLLTGNNGAGKTTLLRTFSTILRPTRGGLELFGLPAAKNLDLVRPRLGLVTHANQLYESLTARENLDLACQLRALDRKRVDPLLARVGLGEHGDRNVGHFSAGMKRRLCIARLLLLEPELALLDEPFGQLDPAGVAFMEEVIAELKQKGTSLIISTHDHDRGRAVCDLHLELESGRTKGELEAIAA